MAKDFKEQRTAGSSANNVPRAQEFRSVLHPAHEERLPRRATAPVGDKELPCTA